MGKAPKVNVPEEHPKAKFHLGTFTAPPPLCLNDMYKSKRDQAERALGKQFSSGMLRHENSRVFPGTMAPPKFLWANKDKPTPYVDKTQYRISCPPDKKKKGFMSSDFPRKDEFSNTIRTEQLRETLKKVKEQAKAAQSQVEARKMAFNTANSILNEGEEALPDLNLPRPPLFDVVYRIPEASLKLARDDRQAGRYYMKQREKIIKTGTMDDPKPRRIESDAAWVNISLNGAPVNLLVTESGEVLARKSMEGRGQHGGGGEAVLQPH